MQLLLLPFVLPHLGFKAVWLAGRYAYRRTSRR